MMTRTLGGAIPGAALAAFFSHETGAVVFDHDDVPVTVAAVNEGAL
jgi:hypothetical protein